MCRLRIPVSFDLLAPDPSARRTLWQGTETAERAAAEPLTHDEV